MGDRTNAERQRRYIARLKARAVEGVTSAPDTAEVAALAQKLAQAEQQLAAAKARILNLEDEIAALRGALAHERKRHAIADVSAIIGSLDIVFGEIDR